MATAIVRSAKNFRNLHQRFYFHTLLTKCRPPIPSPTIADNIQHRALPLIQQVHFLIISFFPIISLIQNDKILNFKNFTFFCVIFFLQAIPFGIGFQSFVADQRFSSTSTTTGTVQSGHSKPNSEGGDKSGDSNQSKSDTGKPIRGGVNFLFSFLFFFLNFGLQFWIFVISVYLCVHLFIIYLGSLYRGWVFCCWL